MRPIHILIATMLALTVSATAADHSAGSAGGTMPGTARTANGSTLSQADQEFIAMAAMSGRFEVDSARLAQSKQLSSHEQELVEMILTDHSAVNAELAGLATAKGFTLPSTLDPAHEARLAAMRELEGRDFATAFHAAQVEAHQDAIAIFTRAARDSEDVDLRAWAEKTLPTLQRHQQHLSATQGSSSGMQGESSGTPGSDRTHPGYAF